MKLDRLTLEVKLTQYIATLDDKKAEEYYCTQQAICGNAIRDFYKWLYAEEDARAARRKQYEELRKEFDPDDTTPEEAQAAPLSNVLPSGHMSSGKYFDFPPFNEERNIAEKVVASLMPMVENPPSADCMAVGHMMRDWLAAVVADAGTKIDTGGGLGSYDLWVKVGGKELIITIKEVKQ